MNQHNGGVNIQLKTVYFLEQFKTEGFLAGFVILGTQHHKISPQYYTRILQRIC